MSSHSECLSHTVSFLAHIITAHVLLFCLQLWFHCTSHLTVMPAGTASRRRGRLTVYYLIVPVHLTHHTHTHTPHRSEEQSHSSIHRSFHRHELGMWSVPSENAGGRWESEAVRKRWGETSPAATSSPRLTTSYISNTHTHIPSCRLPHTNSLYSMSVRE